MIKPQSIFSEAFILEQKMKMTNEEFSSWFEDTVDDIVGGYVETNFEQFTLCYEGKHYFVVSLIKDPTTGIHNIQIGAGWQGHAALSSIELAKVLQTGFLSSDSFEFEVR